MLPGIEVVEQTLSARLLRDEDVEHPLGFFGGLLEVAVDVKQRGIAGMVNAVVGLLRGEGELLPVDEPVLVAVEISVTGHQRVQRPHSGRNVPCRKEQLHTVKHAIAVGVNVVRIGRQAGQVGLVLRQEITERSRGWNPGPLLKGVRQADGGDKPLRRGTVCIGF